MTDETISPIIFNDPPDFSDPTSKCSPMHLPDYYDIRKEGKAALTIKGGDIELTFLKESDPTPTPPQKLIWFKVSMVVRLKDDRHDVSIESLEVFDGSLERCSLDYLDFDSFEVFGLEVEFTAYGSLQPTNLGSVKCYGVNASQLKKLKGEAS